MLLSFAIWVQNTPFFIYLRGSPSYWYPVILSLHMLALPLLGLSLGEQFNLEPLADDCAMDKRYEFMLVSVPLHLVGGYASPPNAVAIK